MLQLPDIRQTRIWQEAKEEGIEEGIEKGTARAVVKLAATNMSPENIAATLDVDLAFVQQVLNGGGTVGR
jgi:predicted transposase YdaD